MPKFVVGNWKMYKTQQQASDFIESFAQMIKTKKRDESWIGLAVPFTLIGEVRQRSKALDCDIHVGAQNMHSAVQGAFTGEIALEMLSDKGAEFVILGHSERRSFFQESDKFINQKVKRALEDKFRAIVCIGDTKEQQQQGKTWEALKEQLEGSLADVSHDEARTLMLAYEPIWAIGTGQKAATEQIAKILDQCRIWLQNRFQGVTVPLLYGGSVNESNVAEIRSLEQVDGILAGGSSLSAADFAALSSHFFA